MERGPQGVLQTVTVAGVLNCLWVVAGQEGEDAAQHHPKWRGLSSGSQSQSAHRNRDGYLSAPRIPDKTWIPENSPGFEML